MNCVHPLARPASTRPAIEFRDTVIDRLVICRGVREKLPDENQQPQAETRVGLVCVAASTGIDLAVNGQYS